MCHQESVNESYGSILYKPSIFASFWLLKLETGIDMLYLPGPNSCVYNVKSVVTHFFGDSNSEVVNPYHGE